MILPTERSRSLIVTVTERPVSRSVTVTSAERALGCAAVRPDHGGSYHVASPVCVSPIAPGTSVVPAVHGLRGRQALLGYRRALDPPPDQLLGVDLAVDDRHEEGAMMRRTAPARSP